MFCVIVSLRSYFYLVAAWNFGDFGGCVLNLPRLTLTLVVLMSLNQGTLLQFCFGFGFVNHLVLFWSQNQFGKFSVTGRVYKGFRQVKQFLFTVFFGKE